MFGSPKPSPRSIAMRRSGLRTPAVAVVIAAGALAFAACSDNAVGPRSLSSSDAASQSVTLVGNSYVIVSDGSTQYCASAQLNGGNTAVGDWSIPASFGPVANCGTAL